MRCRFECQTFFFKARRFTDSIVPESPIEVLEVRLRDGEDEGGDGVIGHGFLLR